MDFIGEAVKDAVLRQIAHGITKAMSGPEKRSMSSLRKEFNPSAKKRFEKANKNGLVPVKPDKKKTGKKAKPKPKARSSTQTKKRPKSKSRVVSRGQNEVSKRFVYGSRQI